MSDPSVDVAGLDPVDEDGADDDDYDDQEPQQRERLKTLIANSETEQKIYKTGFLNKTGGGRKGLKRWKRRYFLLSETALAYFTEENTRPTTTLKGGMLLTAIEDVREADGAEAVRPYMFIVVTPTRTYNIQAPTETQRAEWMEAIKLACDKTKRKRDSFEAPAQSTPPAVKITYFPIRGRPERLRLLLADVGVEFENTTPDDWPALKAQLLAEGLQGTLPLIELPDGTRLTQNTAAIRHFARIHKRYGTSEAEAQRSDMVADCVEDWRRDFDRVAYNPGWLKDAALVHAYTQDVLPGRLKLFEVMLSSRDMEYVAGSASATFADFMVFDCLDVHLEIDPTVLDGYPRLRDFVALIRGRPRIQKYLAARPSSEFAGKGISLAPNAGTVSM